MLHIEIRKARVEAKLSQAALARLAGVPRRTLVDLENGGNFTRDTLLKLIAQLPKLRTLTLGQVTIETAPLDGAGLRAAIEEMMAAGQRALALLETAERQQRSAGVTRVEDGGIPPQLERRLRELEEKVGSMPARPVRDN